LTSVFGIGANPLHVASAAVRIDRRREPPSDRPCSGSDEPTGDLGVVDDEYRQVVVKALLNVAQRCLDPTGDRRVHAHGLEHHGS